ncbi:hypothetical protein [Mycobacterium antarcticum]|uniref:hypothetical protein n=1 Tax=Mycolicibacterium sp. TUM20984 TaxID=3023368 RepID=UPI00238E3F63|nr:hypothetical protein [Mycolicibacterium sp. TUM20984]GLP78621.1 hypothetical protein TUM20984_00410 [Mycolicibacterium sp. TUM20984]
MDDDLQLPTAAENRERSERARVQARSRYRDHLTEVLSERGVDEPAAVADVVLEALTEWRYVDTGEQCTCSCHPRLPDNDRHDYGFDCTCTRTGEQRRESFQQVLNEIRELWQSPDGEQTRATNEAAEAELQDWLTEHPGVAVHSHGGWTPEQWRGVVDRHSFYFRERHGDWHLEIDPRPTGQFLDAVDGVEDDGTTRHRQREVEQGDVIATGTIDTENYGTTLVQRAQFIVTTIRDHLRRKGCTHHLDNLDAITNLLGTAVRWGLSR